MWIDEAVMIVRVEHQTGGPRMVAIHPSGASIQWTDDGILADLPEHAMPSSGWEVKVVG